MFEVFSTSDAWLSLLTLTALEIVLGIDNIIFISILAGRVKPELRDRARQVGLMGALATRLLLLSGISWITKLTTPLFTIFEIDFSGKALILLAGGLFLLYKATKEIHHKLEGENEAQAGGKGHLSFRSVILQVMILDVVFSIDSVITAVGMSQSLTIMILANIIALAIMLLASKSIASFVEQHPTIKVLALSFLLMIGLVLIGESFGLHIPKGYVYFAMAFSAFTEFLNIRASKAKSPVVLKNTPKVKDIR